MADININQIKQLRAETDLSISECKKALEKSKGNIDKAKKILEEWGKKIAQKKAQKETFEGIIESYIHPNKKIGVLLALGCQTDFVAKSRDFQNLAHELCLQIAALGEEETPLLKQPWIKNETKTIQELIDEYIAKLGENITIKKFARYEI